MFVDTQQKGVARSYTLSTKDAKAYAEGALNAFDVLEGTYKVTSEKVSVDRILTYDNQWPEEFKTGGAYGEEKEHEVIVSNKPLKL